MTMESRQGTDDIKAWMGKIEASEKMKVMKAFTESMVKHCLVRKSYMEKR